MIFILCRSAIAAMKHRLWLKPVRWGRRHGIGHLRRELGHGRWISRRHLGRELRRKLRHRRRISRRHLGRKDRLLWLRIRRIRSVLLGWIGRRWRIGWIWCGLMRRILRLRWGNSRLGGALCVFHRTGYHTSVRFHDRIDLGMGDEGGARQDERQQCMFHDQTCLEVK